MVMFRGVVMNRYLRVWTFLIVACLVASCVMLRPGTTVMAAPVSADVSARLREIAASGRLADMERGNFSDYRKLVQAAYEASVYAPLWLNGDRPTVQALGIIKALDSSAQKELNPADYDGGRWSARVDALKGSTDEKRAEFDAALTATALRRMR
jgi:hypothetical protein